MPSFARAAILSAGLSLGATTAMAQDNVMVVFDGSNSMWGQIDGVAKIEIARGVMKDLLGTWTDDRQVGLMAYGHRRRGDCADIETLVRPGAGTRAEILERIDGITPTGKTPLTASVERAATDLAYTDRPATVVLISDGLESCERDPCALARTLEQAGVGFTAHVVGFGLGADQDDSSLACIAEETGGTYVTAGNEAELQQAMSSVSAAVAEAPEPQPDPEPSLPEITVTGPGTAVAGSRITVTWTPTVTPQDYVTIVPQGAEEGDYGPYATVRDADSATLTAPGDAGLYEIRYVHDESDRILGADPLELSEPRVALTGPDTVHTGADFPVGWQPAINGEDYVTVVPTGAEAGAYGDYVTVRDDTEGTLTAPADPGLYELRYVLNVNDATVTARAIEVTEPEVTLEAPDTALTGEAFSVSWTGAVDNRDFVTIVPVGTPEGENGNYALVRDHDSETLKAPAETGMYEVRYVLREGKRTLATAMIEVTEPEVTLKAPDAIRAGDRLKVSWTGAVDGRDYVTIVPVGTPDETSGDYVLVRNDTSSGFEAPGEPGLYELRYVLREGKRVLARRKVEVLPEDAALNTGATLSAPETATAGSRIEVGWSVDSSSADQRITLAGIDQAIFTWIEAVKIKGAPPVSLTLPDETGAYELRFLDVTNQEVLARKAITVE